MRIGIDARHLTAGNASGVNQYTLAILRNLAGNSHGHEFEIITTGGKVAKARAIKILAQVNAKNCFTHTHVTILNRLLNASIFFLRRPRLENLFKIRPDVIWCPNINFISFGKIPTVVTFHDLSFELFKEHYNSRRRLWHKCIRPKRIAKLATSIIVPSEITKLDLKNIYKIDGNKIHVIPHGVSERFGPQASPQDHGVRSRYDLPKNYILHVGTHEPRKNLDTLTQGFLDLYNRSEIAKRLDLKLVLVGMIGDVRIKYNDRLKNLGYVPDEHMPAIYRNAMALLFPSIYEGFGMPILEAFASGIPVITSRSSAMLEVGDNAALFIDSSNAKDISEAIHAIINSQELKNELTARGGRRLEFYDWQKSADDILKVFTNVVR
jgi:alpha-1,3-rhamnosyl/mannosyltransferase